MSYSSAALTARTDIDMRQLRHHTKNALASILAQMSSELSNSSASRRLADQIERRILLTATISDALFGLTKAPGPFAHRLAGLCESVVALLGEDGQELALSADVVGEVPPDQAETLLRVAHEWVGNAVKHGMHVRLIGRIRVAVRAGAGGTVLTVSDDGWGCGVAPRHGEGLRLSVALAEAAGGTVTLTRRDGWTVAELVLPVQPPCRASRPVISIG